MRLVPNSCDVLRVDGLRFDLPNARALAARVQDVMLRTKDGLTLHSWFMWPQRWADLPGGAAAQLKARPVVLFFQENAGVSKSRCLAQL